MGMAKKAVLITGGARRIGAALARGFAAAGYDVALHYHHSAKDAQALQQEIGAQLYQGDLTAPHAATTLLKHVTQDFPNLSLLINNASTFPRRFLKETSEQSIADDLAINLQAPLNLMREFAAQAAQAESIINMLDLSIESDHPAHFAYLVAKKALAGATQMAAREYAGRIRINGICPGHVLPTEADPAHDPHSPPTRLEDVVAAALALAAGEMTGELRKV